MKKIFIFLRHLERHASQPWYPLAAAGVALIDNFIFLIPIAALLITSIFAAPKRWFSLSLWITLGSAIGAVIFAIVIRLYGVSIILKFAPHLMNGSVWATGERWLDDFGLWAMFFISALPLTDHPMIALTALTKIPMPAIAVAVLGGKAVKFFILGWVASHSPRLLLKLKLVNKEVHEIESAPPPKAKPL